MAMVQVNITRNYNDTLLGNGTRPPPSRMGPPTIDYSSVPKLVPLALAIVIVNGLVFLLFAARRSLRTPANYLLLSLAVSDFITGSVNIPLIIAFSVPLTNDYMEWWNIIITANTLSKLTAILTAYHILAVTVEKYLAIVKPLKHHSANPKMAFVVILGVWFASCLIAVTPVFWWIHLINPEDRATSIKLQFAHDVFCFVTVFLIPYTIIIYSQTVMFKAVSRSKNKSLLRRSAGTAGKVQSRMSNERKCLAIFATMAVLFAVCWLPWFALTSLATLSSMTSIAMPRVPPSVFFFFIIIRLFTSVINPLLYTFFKRDFMRAFKIVVCKRRLLRSGTRSSLMTARNVARYRKHRHPSNNGHCKGRKPTYESQRLDLRSESPITEETIMHVTSL